jgi:hypothetical protein
MHNRRSFLTQTTALALVTASSLGSLTLAQDNDWAAKMFKQKSHDFGVVARGADTSYRLNLTNIYEQEVHISAVRTTCGCTAGEPSKETLKSREEAYVTITMDTKKFKQRKDSNVIVVFDKPLYAEVTIPITAYIRQDVVIEPGSAQFGTVYRDDKKEQTLKIQYAGRDDWKITDVKSNHEHVSLKAIEVSRGGGYVNYDLNIALSANVPLGGLRQYMTLVTDDKNSPNIPLLVEADVRADFSVEPTTLALGTMQPGQTVTKQIVIKGRKPFDVESVTCDKAKDVFQVRLPKTAAKVQIIPLTVTAPSEPGTLDEELAVAIPGVAEPIKFRAYAKIGAKE